MKIGPNKSLRFLVIAQLQKMHFFVSLFVLFCFLIFLFIFFCQPVKCTRLLEPNLILHTQSMVAKRGLTNRANAHTPNVKTVI